MSITMIITPADYFDDATMIVNTDGGYIMEDGLFGVNAEITRKGYFGGLSAEMLNNRKFLMGERGVDGWTCTKAERITDRPQESLCNSNFVVLKDGGSDRNRCTTDQLNSTLAEYRNQRHGSRCIHGFPMNHRPCQQEQYCRKYRVVQDIFAS